MQQIARISGGGVGAGTAIGGNGTLVDDGLHILSRSVAAVGSVLCGTSNTF
jgi:hypothetical protein